MKLTMPADLFLKSRSPWELREILEYAVLQWNGISDNGVRMIWEEFYEAILIEQNRRRDRE